jgi:hypothetical protein
MLPPENIRSVTQMQTRYGRSGPMHLPKWMKGIRRWVLVATGVLWAWYFIGHPFEAVSILAGALFLITAWHLIFSPAHRNRVEKRKDRRLRHLPWT